MIIHDIDTIGASIVAFLRKSKRCQCARKRMGPRATLVDMVFIEKLEEDEVVEQHFVEEQTMQTDAREDNVVEAKVQPSTQV